MIEAGRTVLHHDLNSTVMLLIVRVKEDYLYPKVVLLADSDEFCDIEFLKVELDILEEFLLLVLNIKHCQLSIDIYVCLLLMENLL